VPLAFALGPDAAALLDMALALLLGGAIGWERERARRSAGLRTHMLVAAGAALFVALGQVLIGEVAAAGAPLQADPLRLLEAVVAGVGFLGAGTIVAGRGAGRVSGLTTAASLWLTSAIGIAVGLERHLLAVGSTLLVLAVLAALRRLGWDADAGPPTDGRPGAPSEGSSRGRSRG
jgi:putative Mg2+ transporter-C (MgtC) family protein